jgi:hypothetical protein
MNMKRFALGLVLSSIAITGFAQAHAVKQCELTQWCPLPRSSDVAEFKVDQQVGVDYDCVLSVESRERGSVSVLVLAANGYNAEAGEVSVSAGSSGLFRLKGSFDSSNAGLIQIRRVDAQANIHQVFVQCEKAFA